MKVQTTLNPPDEVISTEYDGKVRRLIRNVCQTCGSDVYAPRHVKRQFCSNVCRGVKERTREDTKCNWCSTVFSIIPSRKTKTKSGFLFCSRPCKEAAQSLDGHKEMRPAHYGKGVAKYRHRALRTYGPKCVSCGYDADVRMLDVDHIDRDRSNHNIRNLQVLCVWCHALKTRGVSTHNRILTGS